MALTWLAQHNQVMIDWLKHWFSIVRKTQLATLVLQSAAFAFIVTASWNIFLVLPPETYSAGLRIDYLLTKLYLSDILLLLMVVSWVWQKTFTRQGKSPQPTVKKLLPLAVCACAFASLSFLQPSLFGFWPALLTVSKLGMAYEILSTLPDTVRRRLLAFAVLVSISLQCFLGLYQLTFQQSLFPYPVFGEPSFAQPYKLDRAQLWDRERILPYGSLPHPNVLAGMLTLYSLYLFTLATREQKRKLWLIAPAVLMVVAATQSMTAWFTGGFATLGLLSKSRVFSRCLALVALLVFLTAPFALLALPPNLASHPSLGRRQELLKAGISLVQQHPLAGVGWGQSTRYMEAVYTRSEPVRFVQPVHHIGALFLVENGLLGVTLAVLFVVWQLRNVARARKWLESLSGTQLLIVAVILLLGGFDHYLFTLWPGQLLLVVGIAAVKS